jgi:hypothetical protein
MFRYRSTDDSYGKNERSNWKSNKGIPVSLSIHSYFAGAASDATDHFGCTNSPLAGARSF